MKKIVLLLVLSWPFYLQSQTMPLEVSQLERFSPYQQIPGLKGYDIRARKIVVPPGGVIPEHAHETRPGIVYVLSGEIIEYRGEQTALLKTGDSVIEDINTVHAYKNISDKPCVLIAFDVPVSE